MKLGPEELAHIDSAAKAADEEYKFFHETQRQFDYFVLGLTGALCAYVGEHNEPKALGLNSFTLKLAALVVLGLSGFFGFLKASANVSTRWIAFKACWHELHVSRYSAEFDDLGDESDPMQRTALGHRDRRDAAFAELKLSSLENSKWTLQRNCTLLVGSLLLVVSYFVAAYEAPSALETHAINAPVAPRASANATPGSSVP